MLSWVCKIGRRMRGKGHAFLLSPRRIPVRISLPSLGPHCFLLSPPCCSLSPFLSAASRCCSPPQWHSPSWRSSPCAFGPGGAAHGEGCPNLERRKARPANYPGLKPSNTALKTAPTPVENSRSSLGRNMPDRDGIAVDLVLQQGLGHKMHPEQFLQVARGWQNSHKDSFTTAADKFWAEALYVYMRSQNQSSFGANHRHPDHDSPAPFFPSHTS